MNAEKNPHPTYSDRDLSKHAAGLVQRCPELTWDEAVKKARESFAAEGFAPAPNKLPRSHPTCDQMDRDLEEIRLELEAEARAKEMAAARAASPSGGRVVWCQWCACFEDDPRCTCSTEPMHFQVSEKRRLVIGASCLAKLRAHAQRTPEATEAGGLVLGRLSDDNTCLTLCEATGPYLGDAREVRLCARRSRAPGDGKAPLERERR